MTIISNELFNTEKYKIIITERCVQTDKNVFAKMYNVEGNVASNIQFMATDSIKNVLAGSLYFYTKHYLV